MTVADVLWPSLLYLRLHPSPGFEVECKELLADLPGFYHADTHSISNDFARTERMNGPIPGIPSKMHSSNIRRLDRWPDRRKYRSFLDAFRTAQKMAHQYQLSLSDLLPGCDLTR